MPGEKRGGHGFTPTPLRERVSTRFPAQYIGCCDLQSRYNETHLNEAISQLSDVSVSVGVTLEIVNGNIITYNHDGTEMFCHKIRNLQKLATASSDKSSVVYIYKDYRSTRENVQIKTYKCFLFILETEAKVPELYSAVQEERVSNSSSSKILPSNNFSSVPPKFQRSASLCGDSPPNFSQFYEVLFLGKVKSSHKRAPPTFIDDALTKIRNREAKLQQKDAIDKSCETEIDAEKHSPCHPLDTSVKVSPVKSGNSANGGESSAKNRTMLLQVGRTDLRLISPDTKQVLLHKNFREISHCARGQQSQEHFGFICRDTSHQGQGNYISYIFRCDSVSIVDDIMQCLKSAFQNAHEQNKKDKCEQRCDQCPMVWYNMLAQEVNGVDVRKAQGIILKNLEKLDQDDKENILNKMVGAETPDIAEQNQVLMLLLKVSCEQKQEAHQVTGHTLEIVNGNIYNPASSDLSLAEAESKTDLNMMEAVRSAKRSLAESFNGIMRRRASMDVIPPDTVPGVTVTQPTPARVRPHPLSVTNAERKMMKISPEKVSPNNKMDPLTPSKHSQFECSVSTESPTRQRARTVGSAGGEAMKREIARRRLARLKEETQEVVQEDDPSPRLSIFKKTAGKTTSPVSVRSSRQQIFQRVSTPDKRHIEYSRLASDEGPRDYKLLWQNAIKQQIILGRMEKENDRMLQDEEQLAEKRLKLDYHDLKTSDQEMFDTWECILSSPEDQVTHEQLRNGVSLGVPKTKRGEAWQLLIKKMDTDVNMEKIEEMFPNLTSDYTSLKSQLTSHQHAILIDLGRTFPNHGYFSGALGPGQCGLFNLLKAYSILDPEVGYCQGLPFCVGLLLMHMEEEQSFSMLKHLMFNLGLRRQFHHDMSGLQVSLYCMSRLLLETNPNLYHHLDRLEADPSLYATPWLLTIFAASFPLGFVARVLDLIFLEGSISAVIKVAVCLLLEMADKIEKSRNLEELMNVMKVDLPGLSCSRLEDVIRQAGSLNITRQLGVYEIEFTVLQEEQATNKSQVDRLKIDLEEKTKELSDARAEIASLQLRLRNELAEVNARHIDNNNRKQQNSSSEDTLYKVIAAVEALSTQVPDEIREKLEDIAKLGKESWFSNLNFPKFEDAMDWDNIHDISDDVINDDIEEDGDAHWTGRFFKLSKSPIGSFFGN